MSLDPPVPAGFQAMRPDERIEVYRRNLPHWRQKNATYFVTFRLNDSLPASRLRELRSLREEWENEHLEPRTPEELEQLAELLTRKQENWLDRGHGSCLLQVPDHQRILAGALHHFDSKSKDSRVDPRYDLNAYVLMPNHVHLIVRPFDADGCTLEKILQSWKRFSSREINKARGAAGPIWFEESFDRIIQDGSHLLRCLHYVGRNPVKAGKTTEQCPRWISPAWREFGWDFRD